MKKVEGFNEMVAIVAVILIILGGLMAWFKMDPGPQMLKYGLILIAIQIISRTATHFIGEDA